ncbi:flagellar hook assembly protein FlgD [Thermodesulfobacteriota bacterium]
MITDVAGLTGYNANDYEAEKSDASMGQDEFLQLFLAQLNHQDPLNPLDSTEFSAQLAQFSSLEQLFNVNENLESLKGIQSGGNRFQALELIGKDIEADGNIISHKENEMSSGSFTIDDETDCTVYIKDINGYTVREMSLGIQNPGQHSFSWDGRDDYGNILDTGLYGFEVEAMTVSGEYIYTETHIKGKIDRVNMEGDEPLVYIGDMALSLSQIVDVSLPETL